MIKHEKTNATSKHCPVCKRINTQYFMHVTSQDYWRCNKCQATFLEAKQRPNLDIEHSQYKLHNNEIHDIGYRQFLSKIATPLLAKFKSPQYGLDYGCGPGPALATMLMEAGHNMSLYDPLFCNEVKTLHTRYDFITCTEVVEHFHEPAIEFATLNSLLKPGGWLGIMTQFQTDDKTFANWHYRRDPTHVVFYREETFYTLANIHNWKCEIPCKDVVLMQKRTR